MLYNVVWSSGNLRLWSVVRFCSFKSPQAQSNTCVLCAYVYCRKNCSCNFNIVCIQCMYNILTIWCWTLCIVVCMYVYMYYTVLYYNNYWYSVCTVYCLSELLICTEPLYIGISILQYIWSTLVLSWTLSWNV